MTFPIDPYEAYEAAVQDAPSESRFLERLARRELGRPVLGLREDFCGTFWLGHEWARLSPRHFALGVDLDAKTVAWGRARHGDAKLSARLETRLQDVRRSSRPIYDVVAALNFSYFVFRTREDLLAYFRSARKSLKKPGLLVLDHFGGPEIYKESKSTRSCRLPNGERFSYVWEKLDLDPRTHHAHYAIHFRTPQGRTLRNAFRYDWRLWTLPELKELLIEAGFRRVDFFVEDDRDVFRKNVDDWSSYECWLAYIVARS